MPKPLSTQQNNWQKRKVHRARSCWRIHWIQNQEKKNYLIDEGTVEFSNNKLLVLTTAAKDLAELDQSFITDELNQLEKKLSDNDPSDKEKYILNYKISTLKEINQ